ncbi:uncharacterized protein J7T54_003808 [Emericellopsis cladophorae]|uniref:Nucleoside phosphorylase domain-containing protein n=1 Tax=Emericellopsis cladophorae TaxID=2686198 RepID=A0A9P9XTZ1_9HYPO|nr:uncharacterized protein J7T54_003808 [Emericellopsis cladophorae]KAI6777751.1 hypothetical protein J7T54_003808 [Emericellopsis cladophorae]
MATCPGSDRPPRPNSRNDFHIAILCAIPLEADAVDAVFDFHWDDDRLSFNKTPGDPNAYSTGVIGRHNVVLSHMPGIGVASAASVASACKTSFPNISLGLVVGICGVVPGSGDEERVLGDIIISEGVVQYDFGRQIDGHFERKSTLLDSFGRPPADVRAVLAKLRGLRGREQLEKRTASHLSMLQQRPKLCAVYPGKAHDRLFEPEYKHQDDGNTCDELGCDGHFVTRHRLLAHLADPSPTVHFGLIASGNSVMRSGRDRDRVAKKEDVIAFEMEGAGAWDSFPCVVLKGACDYADNHKNKLWQRYAAAAAAACTKGFLQEWVPTEILVPYPENEGFVQRVSHLRTLTSQLGFGTNVAKSRSRVALYGLGGVGYTFIARDCKIPGYDDPNADTLSLVRTWLERTYRGRWLMVIDNADDTELFFQTLQQDNTHPSAPAIGAGQLGRFVPMCPHGSVLITSRNKQTASRLAPGKPPIGVGSMTDMEALQLVRVATGDDELLIETTTPLAARLEHIPLALAQATAFIEENSTTIDDYIQLLDESDEGLIDRLSEPFEAFGGGSDTPHAVTATWIISFEQIEKQHAFASSVLSMVSLLDRQSIPESFLKDYYVLARPAQPTEGSDLAAVAKALGTLQAFSFISKGKDKTVDMHRLVQLVTRKWLVMRGKMGHFAQGALEVVSNAFPYGGFENRDLCLQYLPHANAVLATKNKKEGDAELKMASLLHKMSGMSLFQGHWDIAEKYLDEAVDTRQLVLGEEHPDTLSSMTNLASTYSSQGRWTEAESLQVQVMETRQRVLGEEHPDALISKANLASTYWNQGRWTEAESLELQVMETTQRVLGEEHPDNFQSPSFHSLRYPTVTAWQGCIAPRLWWR